VCIITHIDNNTRRAMDSKTLIKMLEADGWKLVRIVGSHHHFKKKGVRELISFQHPEKDLPTGTLNKLLKIAGFK
jgi:predicted RNA binding protein YcfA (HicA-like mRNA interferase family)